MLTQVWILPVIYWGLTVCETMTYVKAAPRKLEALLDGIGIVTVSENPSLKTAFTEFAVKHIFMLMCLLFMLLVDFSRKFPP